MTFERPDGLARVRVTLTVQNAGATFEVDAALTAKWDGAIFAERSWSLRVPRRRNAVGATSKHHPDPRP